MHKKALADKLFQKHFIGRVTAEAIVNTIFSEISEAIARDEKVVISDFGVFGTKMRAPRTGMNPHTKEKVYIPSRKVPVFTPSKKLKGIVGDTK